MLQDDCGVTGPVSGVFSLQHSRGMWGRKEWNKGEAVSAHLGTCLECSGSSCLPSYLSR